jgi:6-phosphogluconate dehydrogenase (decarboxylating)
MKQEIGMVGLGKMGAGLAQQLVEKGWRVVGYNRTRTVTEGLVKDGIEAAFSLEELVTQLSPPRVVWVMLPAGEVVDAHLFKKGGLASLLQANDCVIDGGNSFYKDAAPRAKKLAKAGITFLDVGTSGGPGGARHGACLMIGGDAETFSGLEPLFQAIAKTNALGQKAYQFFPGYGAGHFVKMVHNGIEYGMMQALAEGFAIMKAANFELNLQDVARIYTNGSVIESRLTQWLLQAFEQHGNDLADVTGSIKHTGEGEWTVQTAQTLHIPAPVITDSFQFRVDSTTNPSYTGKIVSALREQFGGHSIK